MKIHIVLFFFLLLADYALAQSAQDQTCYCHVYKTTWMSHQDPIEISNIKVEDKYVSTEIWPYSFCDPKVWKKPKQIDKDGNTLTYELRVYGGRPATIDRLDKLSKDIKTALATTKKNLTEVVNAFEVKMEDKLVNTLNTMPERVLKDEVVVLMKEEILALLRKELGNNK